MRRFVLVISMIVLAVAAGSYSVFVPGASTAEKREVHFYLINAATGPSAPYGLRNFEGNKLAGKLINEAGGFTDRCGNQYTIKLTEFDMSNSREQAIAGLRQAASIPSVLAVAGPSPSVGFVPMVPVAGQMKIPLTATGSVAPIKEWNPYVFRLSIPADVADVTAMKRLKEKFNYRRLAIIYEITGDGPRGSAEAVRAAAGRIGYEVVAFEAFRNTDTDFHPQLTKIKASNPDWIAVESVLDHYVQIVNQAAELGIRVGCFTGAGAANSIDPKAWGRTEGKSLGHYTVSPYFSLDDPNRPEVGRFVKPYQAEYKTDPTALSFYGWDAIQLYVDAVKRSCTATDREKFREALATTKNFQGLSGIISFQNPPTGEVQNPTVIISRVTGKDTWEEVK